MVSAAEKVQHEPHCAWSWTNETPRKNKEEEEGEEEEKGVKIRGMVVMDQCCSAQSNEKPKKDEKIEPEFVKNRAARLPSHDAP